VTVSNPFLQGSVNLFAADCAKGKNCKPAAYISGGEFIPGVDSTALLSGIAVNPLSGNLYVTQDFSILAPGLDFVEIFSPTASGASGPFAIIPPVMGLIPLSLPQDVAFVTPAGPSQGEFYVSNFTGGDSGIGNVILFPADAGLPTNPIPTPVGILPSALDCSMSPEQTAIVLPVGVATDSIGNVYVASQGVPGLAPSQVSEYAAGATGCVAPIGIFGLGALEQAEFVAVDPEGDVFVSDLAQNAIFEFSGTTGAVLTEIVGRKTKLKSPMGIALSPAGLAHGSEDLYVANNRKGQIVLFENVDDGGLLNIKPFHALGGNRTKMNLPVGVAPLD
jgi:hypothetical protein